MCLHQYLLLMSTNMWNSASYYIVPTNYLLHIHLYVYLHSFPCMNVLTVKITFLWIAYADEFLKLWYHVQIYNWKEKDPQLKSTTIVLYIIILLIKNSPTSVYMYSFVSILIHRHLQIWKIVECISLAYMNTESC